MKLSPHFALAEFCVSQTAARMGRVIEPTDAEIRDLSRLCMTVLEPLRASLGRPIVVTSGLRPAWLNHAIGGSKSSAHMFGRAADIVVPGLPAIDVCQRVQSLALPVDQCIHEFPPHGWTHLGIAPSDSLPRGQYLTARVINGRNVYEIGLNA